MARTGRPPTCLCGECDRCRRRVRARNRYRNLTLEQKRQMIAARDPERVKANDRARYYRQREERLARMKEYAQKFPDVVRRGKDRWANRNMDKRRAQWTLNNAKRLGKVTPPLFCEGCFQAEPLQAHHEDYSKPLDVQWLCVSCHARLHRRYAA